MATVTDRFVRYSPDLEEIGSDESETIRSLTDTMRSIIETTSEDCDRGLRSVHAKSNALLEGEFEVLDGLPPEYAQGLFAKPGTYPVLLRFSTNPGDVLDDSISVPRGLAVKVIGAEGERLPDSEGETTQDFVMAVGPAFVAKTPKDFLANLKLLAATTDKAEGSKRVLSAVLRGTEKALEAVGGESVMLKNMGGYPHSHPAGEHYFSQTPFRYGDHVAKFSVAPASDTLVALDGKEIDIAGRPDALRDEMNALFAREGGEWELRVQLCTDTETMPIEDASVPWDEQESPYVPVARIRVGPQTAWSDARAKVGDDDTRFMPWRGLAAHRPLGAVNRARKTPYEMSSDLRGTINGCPMHEPTGRVGLPA